MEILFVLIIKIYLFKRVPVKRNKYGREEEKYVCEDCSNCPFKNQCHKSKENRVITVNEELTSYHKEVIDNLECIHGALLRMNRSIQSEGTFGIIKEDRKYKRIVRKGLKAINLEIFMISCGYNLMKYHNKNIEQISVANNLIIFFENYAVFLFIMP